MFYINPGVTNGWLRFARNDSRVMGEQPVVIAEGWIERGQPRHTETSTISAARCPVRAVYFETLTVIVAQVFGIVLCRSSPSCKASLCLPGVSCMSISDLPSPKWTHDGVPLTMVLPDARQLSSTPTW